MVQQSECHKTIQFTIVESMCMYDALIVEEGGYYAEIYHGYNLSHKISYNLQLSDFFGTDSLCDCSAWWSEHA